MARVGLTAAATDLSAVATTGAGAGVTANNASASVWEIIATGVTTGGTVLIQGSVDGTNWYTISSTTVSATGNTGVSVTGPHPYLRSNVSARTDGTYTTKYSLLIVGS